MPSSHSSLKTFLLNSNSLFAVRYIKSGRDKRGSSVCDTGHYIICKLYAHSLTVERIYQGIFFLSVCMLYAFPLADNREKKFRSKRKFINV